MTKPLLESAIDLSEQTSNAEAIVSSNIDTSDFFDLSLDMLCVIDRQGYIQT
jgi:hypothetical protein